MRRALFVVVVLALAALVAWSIVAGWGGRPHSPDTPDARAPATAAADARTAAVDAEAGAQVATRDADDVAARTPLDVSAPTPASASFRGRCVDVDGHPLAGVTVDVHGWVADDQRLENYLAAHDAVEWTDPQGLTTEADGRFEVRFVPPPPYQFTIDFTLAGHVEMGGRWSEIAPGTVKDFGDVVLAPGVNVTGRVVDTAGRPQERVSVHLDRYNRKDRARAEIRARDGYQARTAADGSFAVREPLEPATWNLKLRGRQMVEPGDEVELRAPSTVLEISVRSAEDIQTIEGEVVDDRGAPVPRAEVRAVGVRGSGWINTATRDGRFVIERQENNRAGPFALTAEADGHEFVWTEPLYDWGARDVRIVLPRGLELEVLALRAIDGAPVPAFGVRMLAEPGSRTRWSSSDAELRERGEHEGGLAVVRGVPRGAYLVCVEPFASTDLCASRFERVVLQDAAGPRRVTFHLPPKSERALRVVRGDDAPVVGSRFQLIEPLGEREVTLRSDAAPAAELGYSSELRPLVLQQGTTTAEGTTTLTGPGDRGLFLRVLGPGHEPVLVAGVRLDDPAPLEVVVSPGATVVGRIEPVSLVAELRGAAGLPPRGPLEDAQRDSAPGVRLWRTGPEHFPLGRWDTFVPLTDDGAAFTIENVPPGTWYVELAVPVPDGNRTTRRTVAVPNLRDGERREVTLDLAAWRPGRLVGSVRVDGEPWRGAVTLVAEYGVQPDGQPLADFRSPKVGDDGTFTAELPSGAWRARVWDNDRGFLWALADAVVTPGADTVATFEVTTARRSVRILGPDGSPVAGLRPIVESPPGQPGARAGVTDADGRTEIVGNPGHFAVAANRRAYQTDEALLAHYRAHGEDPAALAAIRVSLGTVDLVPGDTREIELRLPPEWER